MKQGMVVWITGLAGSGKTTIANVVADRLRAAGRTVVVFDGDELRAALGGSAGYTREDREALAMSYARLCRLVADQGLIVICATISLFHSVHTWNRHHLPNYLEAFVRAPKEVCSRRGRAHLYESTEPLVMGRDLVHEEPREPHIVLDNDADADVKVLAGKLVDQIGVRL